MLDIEELEDGGTIVGDGDILGPGCAIVEGERRINKSAYSIDNTRSNGCGSKRAGGAGRNGDSAIEGRARGGEFRSPHTNVVDHHLVEADWAERGLDDVCHRDGGLH